MARYRLARRADADVAKILRRSRQEFGGDARLRYLSLLIAAFKLAALDPEGPLTRQHDALRSGLRSLHVRHARKHSPGTPVRTPVHVIFYRVIEPGLILVLRVLHERDEPERRL